MLPYIISYSEYQRNIIIYSLTPVLAMTVLELITFSPAESYQKDPVAALSPFASALAGAEDINPSKYVALLLLRDACNSYT